MTARIDPLQATSQPSHVPSGANGRMPRKRRGRWLVVPVVLAAISAGVWAITRSVGLSAGNAVAVQTHTVQRGPLRITVVEQGNLESTSNVDVRCEVEGGRVGAGTGAGTGPGTQIIWLFPEGDFVRQGEKIVELDQSALKQQEIEERILLATARQELITAQNNYAAAKIAVDEYGKGTFHNEHKTVLAEIAVAKENLRRADEFAKHTEVMYRRGFTSMTQLEADRFAVENARATLEALQAKLTALADYTREKMVTTLAGARDSAQAALEAAQAKFELEESKLKQIQEQIAKCIIKAPKDGMVIYANQRDRWREEPQIEEGALVRFQQEIIRLPDLSQMQVKAKVHESMIERVKRGQKVQISVDARPDLKLHGTVTNINNQPDPTRWFSASVQEYAVFVQIEAKVDNLKPGMTAEVDILIDELQNVLSVPVQAVVPRERSHVCYVKGESGIEPREVVLGATNDKFIEIKDGLNEGEQVVLNPRAVVPEVRGGSSGKPQPGAAPKGSNSVARL